MNKQEILEKIGEILCEEALIEDASALTMESTFRDDLGMDSLEMIDLVNTMEEEFGVKIDDSELTQIIKAEDAVNKISEMIAD